MINDDWDIKYHFRKETSHISREFPILNLWQFDNLDDLNKLDDEGVRDSDSDVT